MTLIILDLIVQSLCVITIVILLRLLRTYYHLSRLANRTLRYQISEYGFLPKKNCVDLPTRWNYLVEVRDRIPDKDIEAFRTCINNLPDFDAQNLNIDDLSLEERRYLFVLLVTAAAKYIRGFGDENVKTILPKQLAIPLCCLSENLRVPPYMTYYSAVNWNVRLSDPTMPISLSNSDIIISYSHEYHTDVKNFLVQHAMIEQLGGSCLPMLLTLHTHMERNDYQALIRIFCVVALAIERSAKILDDFHRHVIPQRFLEFKRFFSGTEDSTLFPNGVTFEGVQMHPITWGSANGGQSSLLQVFDKLISPNHGPEERKFLEGNLKSVPQAHRDFLQMIENGPNLFDYVQHSNHEELQLAFERIRNALETFRVKHLKLAGRYIPQSRFRKLEELLQGLINATLARRSNVFASRETSLKPTRANNWTDSVLTRTTRFTRNCKRFWQYFWQNPWH